MTPRQMPESTEEVLLDVLHGLEVLGKTSAEMVDGVNQQTANIDVLADAIAHRPTNRALVAVLAMMALFLAVIWVSLRQQVEMGERETRAVVCGLLADVRSFHPTEPVAPGCPVPVP